MLLLFFKQWRTFIIDIDLNYSNAADTACERSKLDKIPSYVSHVSTLWRLNRNFVMLLEKEMKTILIAFSNYFSLILELVNEPTTPEKLLLVLFRRNFPVVHMSAQLK